MHAVLEGHFEAFKLLVFRGASVTQVTDKGATLVGMLAKRGHSQWADWAITGMDLVRTKVFVNQANNTGEKIEIRV